MAMELVPIGKAVEVNSTRWYGMGRLPIGVLGVIQGRSSAGKSSLAAWFVSRWIEEVDTPKRRTKKKTVKAVWIREREGNVNRARQLYYPWAKDSVSLIYGASLSQIKEALPTMNGKHVLIVLDPISCLFGEDKDINQESQVRPYMESLCELCFDRLQESVSIIGINHPRKTAGHMLEAASGAPAWSSVPRVVIRAEKLKTDGNEGFFGQVKNNLGPILKTLRYNLTQGIPIVNDDPDSPCMDSIVSATSGEAHETTDAEQLFLDSMVDGIVRSTTISNYAKSCQISPTSIRRARAKLGLVKELIHDDDGSKYWVWKDPKAGE